MRRTKDKAWADELHKALVRAKDKMDSYDARQEERKQAKAAEPAAQGDAASAGTASEDSKDGDETINIAPEETTVSQLMRQALP